MRIAIHGPMCSGKTTIASMITRLDPRYQRYSFGQKIKDIAVELFHMKQKDRSLLISIGSSMREINQDVWINYVIQQTNQKDRCVIDDLRFQNELDALKSWKIISLIIPREERIKRIKRVYPDDSEDHIQNMGHLSETEILTLPEDTMYIDTTLPMKHIEQQLFVFLDKNK